MKDVLRAIWQFCSFVFVPQWGRKPHEEKDDEQGKKTKTRSSKDKNDDAGQLN